MIMFTEVMEGLGPVYLMTCTRYPNRRKSVTEQLDRMGISYEEVHDDGTDSPWVGNRNGYVNRCGLAKYRVMQRWRESGDERPGFWIVEDDAKFLANLAVLDAAFDALPGDAPRCLLHLGYTNSSRRVLSHPRVQYAPDGLPDGWPKIGWAWPDADVCTNTCTFIPAGLVDSMFAEFDSGYSDRGLEMCRAQNGRMKQRNSDVKILRASRRAKVRTWISIPRLVIQGKFGGPETGKCTNPARVMCMQSQDRKRYAGLPVTLPRGWYYP